MSTKYSQDVKSRAVSYVINRLDRYRSVYGACKDLASKLNVGMGFLRRWVLQAQVDAGDRTGPCSDELAEIKTLKSRVRNLEETNEILRQATMCFARELDPRRR